MATATTLIARQYSDLDLNFTIHPIKKDINRLVNEMAVIHAVKNLILTAHYEKPFQPEVGSNIRKMLFENMDVITASALEREIIQTIANFEPRVRILSASVVPDFDSNSYSVSLQFTIINRTEPVTIRFQLERIR
jgi:phage baseplate assembly protein W